jgi:transposase
LSTLAPFRSRAARLTTMPGISDVLAQVIVSEIGVDMSRFPTAAQWLPWAGLCPRHDESAGKRRSTPGAAERAVARDRDGPGGLGRRAARRAPCAPSSSASAADGVPARPGRSARLISAKNHRRSLPARWNVWPRCASRSTRPTGGGTSWTHGCDRTPLATGDARV